MDRGGRQAGQRERGANDVGVLVCKFNVRAHRQPSDPEHGTPGIAATQRTVETAQYQERVQTYDFDIVVSTVRQSLSPGNEQRDMWSCEARGTEGGRNLAGICDLVVDELINMIIAAPDRPTLIALSKAMDRVLQWNYYVIPNWHIRSFRIAYWDKFGHPDVTPNYGVGTSSWWIDPAKDDFISTQKAGLD